ncbi:MAG TPA: FKBP-type peptidyl-prolyl cis-trans isomerase [Gemmatimonadaceae bacterium]|jgi:peptidylprolyl isomerase|nr:FKBP-type peptidyl-prolyl cis-trans isomerase [Gemmatimonadaceae bacterium]HRQ77648.1 FKBP-type peptidyl-prolyl cis-trans isomerase [Gemmatimonadaceae bacterium]
MRRIGLALLIVVTACAPAPAAAPPQPLTQALFAPEAEVELDQMTLHERGFYWRDIIVGDGRQGAPGLPVHIAYVVRLPDGTEVDRAEPERPLTFKLGERQAIVAMELALRGMKVGGVRQLVVPPDLAYGARGRGRVPPNATLVMIVRLVKVE